jgi:hypothetical protein
VKVDAQGVVTPLADGTAAVTATAEGVSATLEVKVENAATTLPINFANQIVPIFTKTGCNAGGCHGKASGQNGFKLSLLGFEPAEDYEHLVKEARGRRVFPAAPDNSLLLLKATNAMPHGGWQTARRGLPMITDSSCAGSHRGCRMGGRAIPSWKESRSCRPNARSR